MNIIEVSVELASETLTGVKQSRFRGVYLFIFLFLFFWFLYMVHVTPFLPMPLLHKLEKRLDKIKKWIC